jgi:hypothetical protein
MQNNISKTDLKFIAIFMGFASIYFACLLDVIEGDPTIYLSFAKNFFIAPFSFGPDKFITFGATSPAYLVFLSAIHSFGIDSFVKLHKLSNLIFLFFGILLCTANTNFSIQKRESNLVAAGLLCSILLWFNFNIVDNSARHYESAFVYFYTALLSFLFIRNRVYSTVFVGAFAYLIRPEIIVLQLACIAALFLIYKKISNKKLLGIILVSLAPALIYHYYIFINSGALFPSSIFSRAVRNEDISFFSVLRYTLSTNPQVLIFFALSTFFCTNFFIEKIKKQKSKFLERLSQQEFLFIVGLFFGLLIILSKGLSSRYIEFTVAPMTPFLCVLIYSYLNKQIFKSIIFVCFFMSITIIPAFKVLFSEYRNDSYLSNRLDKDFASQMNLISSKIDKIAIYEIELQYYLNAHAVSLDARVGSEMKDFFLGKENLLSAMKRNSIRFLAVDHFGSPKIQRDEFYKFILNQDSTLPLNSIIYYKGHTLKKVLARQHYKFSWDMWESIYELDPIL